MRPEHWEEYETITSLLGDDHERLDRMLDDAYDLVAIDPERARRIFSTFCDCLLRHIEIEDEVLFPAFERLSGERTSGPTTVMRREHREIELELAHISEALAARPPDLPTLEDEMSRLRTLLADHNDREEGVLYPACDRILGLGEVRAVRAALERTRSQHSPASSSTKRR